MKRYIKEWIILLCQLLMFYVFPLFAGPTDAMGMVVLIIFATLLFSFVMGALSKRKMKFLYPVATAVLFIPSVFIYYNESALVHALWYLVVASIGLLIGSGVNKIYSKLMRK